MCCYVMMNEGSDTAERKQAEIENWGKHSDADIALSAHTSTPQP